MSVDEIWYRDVQVLLRRWKEFFPTPDQTSTERVNALVRLVIYATLAMFVYNRQPRTLVFGAGIVAVVSVAFGGARSENYPAQPTTSVEQGSAQCTQPTKDNPFSNVLLGDLSNDKRPPACKYDDVRDEVSKQFNSGLFRNIEDVYDKENSQRQFYTMPVTTTIPDTAAFSNFLYGGMKSCKDNMAHCPERLFHVGNGGN